MTYREPPRSGRSRGLRSAVSTDSARMTSRDMGQTNRCRTQAHRASGAPTSTPVGRACNGSTLTSDALPCVRFVAGRALPGAGESRGRGRLGDPWRCLPRIEPSVTQAAVPCSRSHINERPITEPLDRRASKDLRPRTVCIGGKLQSSHGVAAMACCVLCRPDGADGRKDQQVGQMGMGYPARGSSRAGR
jgi:hypothetical protein